MKRVLLFLTIVAAGCGSGGGDTVPVGDAQTKGGTAAPSSIQQQLGETGNKASKGSSDL